MTFTSSSTVHNLCALPNVPEMFRQFPQLKIASIGPQTSLAVVAHGLDVAAEAKEHTIPGLVETVLTIGTQ